MQSLHVVSLVALITNVISLVYVVVILGYLVMVMVGSDVSL